MVELTGLGVVFAVLALAGVLFARRWLAALVAFGASLQAASVIDVTLGAGAFGVTPYAFAVALSALALLPGLWRGGLRAWREDLRQRPIALLLAYFAVALVGVPLLPWLFAGTPVYVLIGPYGFGAHTTPLALGLSQAAQTANLLVHATLLALLLHLRRQPGWQPMHLLAGLALGAFVALLVGIYERAALLGWTRSYAIAWMNNPGYSQGHGAEVGGLLRISAPFSEPSYGSTFLAAVGVGLLAVAAFGRAARPALFAALALGAALLNTLGTSGLVAATLGGALLLTLLSLRATPGLADRAQVGARARAGWGMVLMASVALWWGVAASPFASQAQQLIEQAVVEKLLGAESLSTTSRTASNAHAWALAWETWGLGVGLGGNRASSYLASLLSNVGLAGLVIWCSLLWMLLRRYARAPRLADHQLFAFWAMLTASFAMTIGVPDLNLPLYWVLVFAALLFAPASAGTRTPATASG